MGAMNQPVRYQTEVWKKPQQYTTKISISKNSPSRKSTSGYNKTALRFATKTKGKALLKIAIICIVVMLLSSLLVQKSLVQNMGLRINEQKITLQEINAENEELKQQIAALSNNNVIKEKAEKKLGMKESEQLIVYSPTNQSQGNQQK